MELHLKLHDEMVDLCYKYGVFVMSTLKHHYDEYDEAWYFDAGFTLSAEPCEECLAEQKTNAPVDKDSQGA